MIKVRAKAGATNGVLRCKGKTYPCAVGRSGILNPKFEGDGGTPAGVFALREVRYRPDRLARAFAPLRAAGLFSSFPFGTDLTREEIVLARALRRLEEATFGSWRKLATLAHAAVGRATCATSQPYLERMGLAEPDTFAERLTARLVRRAVLAEIAAGPA